MCHMAKSNQIPVFTPTEGCQMLTLQHMAKRIDVVFFVFLLHGICFWSFRWLKVDAVAPALCGM